MPTALIACHDIMQEEEARGDIDGLVEDEEQEDEDMHEADGHAGDEGMHHYAMQARCITKPSMSCRQPGRVACMHAGSTRLAQHRMLACSGYTTQQPTHWPGTSITLCRRLRGHPATSSRLAVGCMGCVAGYK